MLGNDGHGKDSRAAVLKNQMEGNGSIVVEWRTIREVNCAQSKLGNHSKVDTARRIDVEWAGQAQDRVVHSVDRHPHDLVVSVDSRSLDSANKCNISMRVDHRRTHSEERNVGP